MRKATEFGLRLSLKSYGPPPSTTPNVSSHLSGRIRRTGQGELAAILQSEAELLLLIASLNLVVGDVIAVHCALKTLERDD